MMKLGRMLTKIEKSKEDLNLLIFNAVDAKLTDSFYYNIRLSVMPINNIITELEEDVIIHA